jgi:hypothetical protein
MNPTGYGRGDWFEGIALAIHCGWNSACRNSRRSITPPELRSLYAPTQGRADRIAQATTTSWKASLRGRVVSTTTSLPNHSPCGRHLRYHLARTENLVSFCGEMSEAHAAVNCGLIPFGQRSTRTSAVLKTSRSMLSPTNVEFMKQH